MTAIALRDVAKTYGRGRKRVDALQGVSMTVERGEVFGLLGPNGAGKSTLVKILMTVIRASHAEGTVLDQPLGDRETLRRVGYLPEHHRFPSYLTASQVVQHIGAMTGVPRRERRMRSSELLELVGIGDWTKDKVGTFSKGMRQRLGIAQSLINDPDLVLLDEPTDGVDPVGRRDIREIVHEIRDRGKTVVLNSHLLSELEMVCERIAILVKGRVAEQGSLSELTSVDERYEIELSAPPAADRLEQFEGLSVNDTSVVAPGYDAEKLRPVLAELVGSGATVVSVKPVRPNLEDLFIKAVIDPETGKAKTPGADRKSSKGGDA